MLEDLMNVMEEEFDTVQKSNIDIKNYIDSLAMYSHDEKMLTNLYTGILNDDSVVYIVTRISQNPIFKEHFPELYQKNEFGESVINCQQNTPYHKYGVFKHILFTVEYVGNNYSNYTKSELKILKWTMLLHDIGKPYVKRLTASGNDSFEGHDDMSVTIARGILDRFDFTAQEKKTILTLIKYHDRFLNEGELTYDNLRFLANELEENKKLFNMLIEVKLADNRAKSIDVYNTFMKILPKYTSFVDEYFASHEEVKNNTLPVQENNVIIENEETVKPKKAKNKNITDAQYVELYEKIRKGEGLDFFYQPIVYCKNFELFGYNVITELPSSNVTTLAGFLRKSKVNEKYTKISNQLLINTIEKIYSQSGSHDECVMVKTDIASLMQYNNISRLEDLTDKYKVALRMVPLDGALSNERIKFCERLRKKNALIVLDQAERSKRDVSALLKAEFDIVKYDLMDGITDVDVKKLRTLASFCVAHYKKLFVTGVNNEDIYQKVLDAGADLVQGNYIGTIKDVMDYENTKISVSADDDEFIV